MTDKLNFLKGKIKEYIKFNIVGTSNFIVSQILYITLFTLFKLNYIIAYTITSILSVIASYFLNSKFTFKNENYSTKRFFLSILVYIFEYILNMGIIILLVQIFNVNKIIAPLISPVFSTPPVFFLMRFVIKNKKI
ncbi:GtrA family protein [Romboutsia sp. 13368]|uniref:GtrA family protein n=1 Tax=Romboutsia sp. 13368 TaxID=2708053 RepID=UPI0025D32EF8|nr:GtrA family protein [Romboutsia sp. 13368]